MCVCVYIYVWASLVAHIDGKKSACNAEDPGSTAGLE